MSPQPEHWQPVLKSRNDSAMSFRNSHLLVGIWTEDIQVSSETAFVQNPHKHTPEATASRAECSNTLVEIVRISRRLFRRGLRDHQPREVAATASVTLFHFKDCAVIVRPGGLKVDLLERCEKSEVEAVIYEFSAGKLLHRSGHLGESARDLFPCAHVLRGKVTCRSGDQASSGD